eukprot:TRINITY_DN100890_c0_g1_i1.p1 TRINITY_DN100890_c0_g1~~TRINITY_DN100890_c0_g1_i1.p1  ORF type:complete len:1112 (-),score=403.40 TRINITY_DN100890_c0_g1_i1:307-3642(-)
MAAELAEVLNALLSNDNSTRSAAEKKFDEAKKQNPTATVSGLFQVLAEKQLPEPVREQGAVLLRQCLSKINDKESIWSKLGAAGQAESKASLLKLLESTEEAKVRRKIADIVQSVGNQLIDINDGDRPNNAQQWPEMMPALMKGIMTPTLPAGFRADCLWAVKEMQCSIWQIMVANTNQTGEVLKNCLSDADEGVRGCCATLFCEMIDNINNREERKPFAPLVELFCTVLKQLAESADNKNINSALQSLQGTTESADFFKDCMGTAILPLLSTIAKSHKAEETQRLAGEAVISLGESRPKAMAKLGAYTQSVIDIAVHFLMQMEDDVEGWADEIDEDADDEESFTFGKELIDRLSRFMSKVEKFPQVLETVKPAIATLFSSGQWKQTVAAIVVLSQIVEFVDDEDTVKQMAGAIKAQLRAQHPRVRHAAWSAVAQFAVDHAEVMTSEALAPEFMPEFLNAMDDPCVRVKERSMEAFQHFGEHVERELIEPMLQSLMTKLGGLLQAPQPSVQRKTITFIAVVAGQVEDSFAPYYGDLMPLLKKLIESVLHKAEERTLLGKCFECISLLAKTVGPAVFAKDAEGIMGAMIKATQVPNLPNNDPVKEYMMAAAERICAVLKGDFLPFVPHLLPFTLEKFTLAPKEYNSDSAQNDLDEGDEVNLTLLEEDGKVKVLIMSTSEMEDLQNAVSCVHTFVEELGGKYAPFVAQTAQALLPVFEFSMGEEVRELAFETWGQLCNAAREGNQPDVLAQLVQEFMNRILAKIKGSESLDLEALKTRSDGVTYTLKKAGPGILNAEQVTQISDVAMGTLEESIKRREASKSGFKPPPRVTITQDDEEDADEDDEADEMNLRIAACEMLGALMMHHPDLFVQGVLPKAMLALQNFLQSTDATDTRLAYFLACDMLEHLQGRITGQWPQFMPQLLQGIVNADTNLRQPACYGASLAAKEPAFAPLAAETASKLAEVITQSRSRTKKKSERPAQACADNALSALMEVMRCHSATVASNEAQLWNVWVQGLPCQEDEQEGKKNHQFLLQMVDAEKAQVIGANCEHLPHILGVFVDIYKTDMASDETSAAIGKLFLKFGQAKLEQMAGQLKDKQQKKLLRIYREASQ